MFDHKHGPSRAHGAFKARFSPVNGGRGGDDDGAGTGAGTGAGAGGGAGNPLSNPVGIAQSTSDPNDAPVTETVVVTIQPTTTLSKPVKPPVTPTIPATVSKPVDTTTAVNTPTPPVDPVNQSSSSSSTVLSTSTTPLVPITQSSVLSTIQSATATTPTTTSSKATGTGVKGHASAQNNEGGAITTTSVVTAAGKSNHSISSSAATPTTTSTGVSKGVMVGGISVAVVAGLGILIALIYMLRRCRKREDNFDSNDFKRKSMAIPDGEPEPSAWQPHENASAGGPRPPSMLQRSTVQPSFAPSFAPQPDMYMDHNNMGMHNGGWAQGPSYGHYGPGPQMNGGYPMANAPSFSPGEVVFNSPHSPPATAGPQHPGFFVPGPGTGAYGAARGGMDAYGHPNPGESLPGTPTKPYGSLVDAHPSPLQRKDSQTLPSQERESAFYTDMDRASVTPFQARQYSEIQNRLEQIPAPAPPMPAISTMSASSMSAMSEKQRLAVQNQENDTLSPFDDAAAPAYSLDVSQNPHQSYQEEATHEVDLDLEEPTPAFVAQHQRIDSKPPTLPELAPRPFSPVSINTHEYSFTLHPGSSEANGPQSAVSEGFPTTPLPPQTPSVAEHKFAGQQEQTAPVTRAVPAVTVRPETVYDIEDAYDGI